MGWSLFPWAGMGCTVTQGWLTLLALRSWRPYGLTHMTSVVDAVSTAPWERRVTPADLWRGPSFHDKLFTRDVSSSFGILRTVKSRMWTAAKMVLQSSWESSDLILKPLAGLWHRPSLKRPCGVQSCLAGSSLSDSAWPAPPVSVWQWSHSLDDWLVHWLAGKLAVWLAWRLHDWLAEGPLPRWVASWLVVWLVVVCQCMCVLGGFRLHLDWTELGLVPFLNTHWPC